MDKNSEFKTNNWDSIPVKRVSLSILEKNVDRYDGEYIETQGTYRGAFEMFAIFPDQPVIGRNFHGFWLGIDRKLSIDNMEFDKLNGKEIRIRGMVDKNDKGHLGQYAGSISKIYYIKKVN